MEQLHQLVVRSGLNPLPEEVFRCRVQCPADLDVVIAVDGDLSVDRHLVGHLGRGQQHRGLVFGAARGHGPNIGIYAEPAVRC